MAALLLSLALQFSLVAVQPSRSAAESAELEVVIYSSEEGHILQVSCIPVHRAVQCSGLCL